MGFWIKGRTALIRQFRVGAIAQGFTLIELMVIIVIIGIFAAMVIPGWLGLMNRLQVTNAQDVAHQAIRDAQATARRIHLPYQASFRESNGMVQWAIHPTNGLSAAIWNDLSPIIQIDTETTLQLSGGVRRVQFDEDGNVNGQLGRLTLSSKAGGKVKRCVIVSTLIGAVRKGEDHPTKVDGKFCY